MKLMKILQEMRPIIGGVKIKIISDDKCSILEETFECYIKKGSVEQPLKSIVFLFDEPSFGGGGEPGEIEAAYQDWENEINNFKAKLKLVGIKFKFYDDETPYFVVNENFVDLNNIELDIFF